MRRSPLTAFPGKVLFCAFGVVFLLATANAQNPGKVAPSRQITSLVSREASKLLIHVENPTYPPIARINFIQGTVKLEIRVSAKGHVVETHVVKGEPLLAAAALRAVQKWRYRPYVSTRGPESFVTYVIIKFSLSTYSFSFKRRLPTHANAFLKKQIRPPEVVYRPKSKRSASWARMKVLVGSDGEVLDVTPLGKGKPVSRLARKDLKAWKFKPARWGALAVPWYITVQVPLETAPLQQDASAVSD